MSSTDFVKLALQLSVMLACALVFGQMLRRLRQPAVVGEMLGGILVGPTVLAVLLPSLYGWLFDPSGNIAVVRDTSTKLGMLFFLFLAGLEIDLSAAELRRRRAKWRAPKPYATKGVLAKYARIVSSASLGAVTD